MSDARVTMLSIDEARSVGEDVGVPAALAELNIFRVLLHRPHVAKALADLLITLLFRNSLDARLRELVIMRLGWETGSVYEWTQHWRIALDLGVPEEDLLAVRDWAAHDFGPTERAVLAAVDDVLRDGAISAGTWSECVSALGDDGQPIELVAAISTWRMISTVLLSLDVPLEDGVDPWPPDGAEP